MALALPVSPSATGTVSLSSRVALALGPQLSWERPWEMPEVLAYNDLQPHQGPYSRTGAVGTALGGDQTVCWRSARTEQGSGCLPISSWVEGPAQIAVPTARLL